MAALVVYIILSFWGFVNSSDKYSVSTADIFSPRPTVKLPSGAGSLCVPAVGTRAQRVYPMRAVLRLPVSVLSSQANPFGLRKTMTFIKSLLLAVPAKQQPYDDERCRREDKQEPV